MALNMDTSGVNMALPSANVALSGANVALPSSNVALSSANVTLPGSNVALAKRYTKQQLKKMLVEICSEWITVEEIAAALGRDAKYVKNHVIPQMADIIEKMYDVPHHPRQKYRVKREI